eukprot:Hpha_TRINITY_DN29476_c0_g1::TRINITY_DN29476_c0_g1_i1::g.70179::m.70179
MIVTRITVIVEEEEAGATPIGIGIGTRRTIMAVGTRVERRTPTGTGAGSDRAKGGVAMKKPAAEGGGRGEDGKTSPATHGTTGCGRGGTVTGILQRRDARNVGMAAAAVVGAVKMTNLQTAPPGAAAD